MRHFALSRLLFYKGASTRASGCLRAVQWKAKLQEVKRYCSHGEFLEIAFDVARRWKDFDDYGGSKLKAYKAIARRCNGFSAVQCENALEKAILLYAVAEKLVKKNKEKLWQTYNKPEGAKVGDILCAELKQLCPGFKLSTYKSAIAWLFFCIGLVSVVAFP